MSETPTTILRLLDGSTVEVQGTAENVRKNLEKCRQKFAELFRKEGKKFFVNPNHVSVIDDE